MAKKHTRERDFPELNISKVFKSHEFARRFVIDLFKDLTLLALFLGHFLTKETMNCRPADNPSYTTTQAMFIKIRIYFLAIQIQIWN